ncbi:hypothetical protein FRC08_006710 [Ceratobasidium sp. 394]|nr:hypothetical protein FRC08_006710 [Ceratobasidium sp. 394]
MSEAEWEDAEAEDVVMSVAGKEKVKEGELSGEENQIFNLAAPPKRRGSRLDPGFFKSFGGGGSKALGSLAEESPRALRAGLADVSNQVRPGMSWGGVSAEVVGSSTPTRKPVAIGEDSVVLPAKRVPGSVTKSARRRSGLGLVVAKARRRSSQIPTLSPPGGRAGSTVGASGSGSSGPQRQRVPPLMSPPQRSPFKLRGAGMGHSRRMSGAGRMSFAGVGPARMPLKATRAAGDRFTGDQSFDFSAMRGAPGKPLWK